jgi:hypothetical protein
MCEGKGSTMGRGRQKAKHTKVARELKYFSPDTDLTKLESELGVNPRLDEDLAKWPEYSSPDSISADAGASDVDETDETDEVQSA